MLWLTPLLCRHTDLRLRRLGASVSAVLLIVDLPPYSMGKYAMCGSNHGRPCYRKLLAWHVDAEAPDVLAYFYDDRDGTAHHGWWIGFAVGVPIGCARHLDHEARTPLVSGWRIPDDGPVDTAATLGPPSHCIEGVRFQAEVRQLCVVPYSANAFVATLLPARV